VVLETVSSKTRILDHYLAFASFNLTFGTGVLHLIQINHQPVATIFQFIILTFVYSLTYLLSYCGDSRAVLVVGPAGRPARPRTQHDYHHDMKVKPEAATAVIELLMMGGKTPETC
jgi:hypothetical protein